MSIYCSYTIPMCNKNGFAKSIFFNGHPADEAILKSIDRNIFFPFCTYIKAHMKMVRTQLTEVCRELQWNMQRNLPLISKIPIGIGQTKHNRQYQNKYKYFITFSFPFLPYRIL